MIVGPSPRRDWLPEIPPGVDAHLRPNRDLS